MELQNEYNISRKPNEIIQTTNKTRYFKGYLKLILYQKFIL